MNTEEIQKILKIAKVALVILAIFLAMETLLAFKNLRSANVGYNSISVTGEGEAVAIPDIASFSFSVSADAKLTSDAQDEVTKKIDVILAGLKKLGIEDKDIKTTDYSVWPKYTSERVVCGSNYCPPWKQIPDGYTASHGISVKVRDTKDAGKALSLVGDGGATNISGISFTVDDQDKILDEARTLAITDAKEKAKSLSKKLGVRLVRVVSFYDNLGGGPVPYYGEAMGGDMVKTATPSAPTIPAGENKIKMSVTITYEIR